MKMRGVLGVLAGRRDADGSLALAWCSGGLLMDMWYGIYTLCVSARCVLSETRECFLLGWVGTRDRC